jgi:hypothetical protein
MENLHSENLTKKEPTKNEVVTCYNKVLIDADGLDKTDLHNKVSEEQSKA